MFFSIQILIKKVLKNCFFQLLASFGFGECFLHEVIAEFVLPKKYLPELEKYILCIFFNILCMLFFSILKCSEDSEIPNSIFYVVGLHYIYIYKLKNPTNFAVWTLVVLYPQCQTDLVFFVCIISIFFFPLMFVQLVHFPSLSFTHFRTF